VSVQPVWDDVLDCIAAALAERAAARGAEPGADGWLVGGGVRDALLGDPVRDLDVIVAGDPTAIAAIARSLPSHMRRGLAPLRHDTLRVVVDPVDRLHLDLTSLRGESLAEDLAARDFTINAMAFPLARWRELLTAHLSPTDTDYPLVFDALIDPLGGQADLRARRLRLASPHVFIADPGRMFRGARFLARFCLIPTAETEAAVRASVAALSTLSVERVREELNLLFTTSRLAVGVAWLRSLGALAALFPSLERPLASPMGSQSAAEHVERSLAAIAPLSPAATSQRTDLAPLAPLASLPALRERYAQPLPLGYPRYVALGWALLAHAVTDHAEAATTAAAVPLPATIPGGQIHLIVKVVAWHWRAARDLLAEEAPALVAIRRYFALFAGREDLGVDALVVAAACAVGAAGAGRQAKVTTSLVRRAAELVAVYLDDTQRFVPPPVLTGDDIVRALPEARGPRIGQLLRAVRAAQLEGGIITHDEALALARKLHTEGLQAEGSR